MQLVKCVKCEQVLCRVNPETLKVYRVKAEREDESIPPEKGLESLKEGEPVAVKPETIKFDDFRPEPMFSLSDRETVIVRVENKETGVTEETAAEEPVTMICPCGHINKIY
jgi:hypothetical protein